MPRLLILTGVLVLVLATCGGLAAAATTTTTATTVPTAATSTTTTSAGSTTTVSVGPLFSDAPYDEAKAGKITPEPDLAAAAEGYVTRGQLAIRIAEQLGLSPSDAPYFDDVTGDAECFGAVGALYEAKLLTGVAGTQFLPDQLVGRAQALVWITDALTYKSGRDSTSTVPFRFSFFDSADEWLRAFKDRDMVADVLKRGVANAYRLGLVDVPSDGCLYPGLPLNDNEMTAMLDRAFSKTITARTTPPEAVKATSSYPNLKLKSEGPLVWYLEYQLTALMYRPGPIDGIFDIRTRDAVLAFEKVEKLKRDGIAGDNLFKRLANAETPLPKRDELGTRVEVDLTRQVLFMITDNKVTQIVHVSTGAATKSTLTGHFEIEHKMAGWVTSSYRTAMYYTSFFDFDHRLAIHGYAQVPVWPASHGCVRVPVWMAKEIYERLTMGTHVYIYR
jgi:lipoprotein-anchoring transpeptidase ErfK/SrfK